MNDHVHDCFMEQCNNYTVSSSDKCEESQQSPCRDCLLKALLELKSEAVKAEQERREILKELAESREQAEEYLSERNAEIEENERLRGVLPEFPPRSPDGDGLPRYGIRWNGPDQPLAVPMAEGYWTPWHLAEAVRKELEERWEAEVGHANRHHRTAQDLRRVLAEFERRERHHALYNAAWLKAVEEGASSEQAHKIAQKSSKAGKP